MVSGVTGVVWVCAVASIVMSGKHRIDPVARRAGSAWRIHESRADMTRTEHRSRNRVGENEATRNFRRGGQNVQRDVYVPIPGGWSAQSTTFLGNHDYGSDAGDQADDRQPRRKQGKRIRRYHDAADRCLA